MPATWKKLAYADEVVPLSDYSANSVLAANAANAPAAVVMGEQTILGRITGGNIAALTPANVLTMINVEAGAQACNAVRVAAAGAIMESDIAAKGDLIVGANAGNAAILGVGANGQILKVGAANAVGWANEAAGGAFPNTANGTTRAALTPALGDTCFQVDTLEAYICTVIA